MLESFLLKSLADGDLKNETKIIETVSNEELNCLSLTNDTYILKVIEKNETVERIFLLLDA